MAQWIRYVYLMLILPWITQAQYYRGGSITTKPTADGMIEVSYQLFLDRNGHSCDSTTIGSEGAGGLLFCYGCSGPTVGLLNYRCVDFSVNGEWTMGRGVIEHNPGVMDFITLFTNGPTWVQPFDDIFYNLSTTVNLNRRGDTGVMNSSPVAHLIPDIHLAHGCDHYIQIPVTDPDDDIIKCRYALDATECGGGLCGVGTAGITLDEDSCTLKIDSTTIVPGLHAVTLMVEDFSPTDTTQPLSEVGLQFLIRALDPSFPCNTRPNFQSSDFYSDMCIGTFANTTLITKLTVNGLGPNSAMSEFHYVSTEDITVSELREGSDPSTALADLTWTPDEAVSNGKICFYATSSGGLPSPWFCVDLRTNGPEIQEQSLSWQQAELSSFKTLFSATFTTGIQRPKQEAHILFLDTLTGTPYYVIDVTSERGMSEVMYLDDGLLTIFPDYELYLPNATNISILLDAGVVLKDNCFIANADISDRNKWVFIKTGFCSTPEPNTCASEQTIETTTLPPSCNCPQGYSSSDATCICNDIDECTMSSGRICSDLCTNIPGSFLCACTQGFVISADSFNCTDVDECELYNGGCQHTCANTKGSYFCECSLGYTLHENQHSCKDIDECLVGSNNCSGLCINTESSYRCLCSMGYTLSSSNSNSCIDKDECKSYNGGCSHTCVNVDGSYRCECDEGFRLHPNQHFCIGYFPLNGLVYLIRTGEQTVNNITTNTTPSTCSCDLLMPFLTSSIILFLLFAWLAFYVIRNVLYLQQLNRGLSSFHQREYPEYRPPYGFKRPRPLWKPIGRVKRWPVRRTGTSRGRSQLTRF